MFEAEKIHAGAIPAMPLDVIGTASGPAIASLEQHLAHLFPRNLADQQHFCGVCRGTALAP